MRKAFFVVVALVFAQVGLLAAYMFWPSTEPVLAPCPEVAGADRRPPAAPTTADPTALADGALPHRHETAAPTAESADILAELPIPVDASAGMDMAELAASEALDSEPILIYVGAESTQGTSSQRPASSNLAETTPLTAGSTGTGFTGAGASSGGGSASFAGSGAGGAPSGGTSSPSGSSGGSSSSSGRVNYPPFVATSTYPGTFSRDVESVWASGDSTLAGMEVVEDYFADGAFLVVTTGARYEYAPGRLDVYQGLGADKRHLATLLLTIPHEEGETPAEPIRFEKVTATKDHILYWSDAVNIGIYGDSTCLIAPKQTLEVACQGHFRPDYNGRYLGELLLIDDRGGMEIYPQRYEAGYQIKTVELKKHDWRADYALQPNQRVMVAAFPGKPFDWDYYFNSEMVATYASTGKGAGNPYGQMPPDNVIREWAKHFQILFIHERGIYINELEPGGPYIAANPPEFRRLLRTAKECGLKVIPYTSPFYHVLKYNSLERYFEEVCDLVQDYGIDGVYVDHLPFGYSNRRIDNKIASWETVRRLRQIFGAEGVIVYHGTNKDGPSMRGWQTAAVPNIDSNCNIVLMGEGVHVQSLDDEYLNYHVRKYGISNSIGIWLSGSRNTSRITREQVTDKMLEMFGHELTWADVPVFEPPPRGYYTWGNGLMDYYTYYRAHFDSLKQNYINKMGQWRTE